MPTVAPCTRTELSLPLWVESASGGMFQFGWLSGSCTARISIPRLSGPFSASVSAHRNQRLKEQSDAVFIDAPCGDCRLDQPGDDGLGTTAGPTRPRRNTISR